MTPPLQFFEPKARALHADEAMFHATAGKMFGSKRRCQPKM